MGVFQYFGEKPITPVWVGGSIRARFMWCVIACRREGGFPKGKRYVGVCVIYVVWGHGGGGGGGVPP